jgi:hypothetical protein
MDKLYKVDNYKKKLLSLDDDLDNMIFKLNNKRQYDNGTYHDLILNNNFYLNLLFEANIYDFNPNNKIFLQIKEKEKNNYLVLINKIKYDLDKNVVNNKSLFIGNNNDGNNYILADINKSNDNIYTKFYKLEKNNSFKLVNINLVPNNFRAIITIRIKSLFEKDDKFMLNNDIFQIIIKDEIILDKNNNPEDLDIIKDFIFG